MEDASPLDRHAASPAELQQRMEAEQTRSAFLVYRDGAGAQQLVVLDAEDGSLTVGRGSASTIRIDWDDEVSRIHAELQRIGTTWTVSDMGLSRNGTYVNGERLTGRRVLADRDLIRVGRTVLAYRSTAEDDQTTVTALGETPPDLSPAQRAVLVELCRPLLAEGNLKSPATNRQIADRLIIGQETVKTHIRVLFEKFGVADLAQNQKRAALVEAALRSGAVGRADID